MKATVAVLIITTAVIAFPAVAAVWVVDSFGDGADPDPADASCDGDTGAPGDQCTLRAAVQQANLNVGPDEIQLSAGIYRLTIDERSGDTTGAFGPLDVWPPDGLVIAGAGAPQTVIDGRRIRERIFQAHGDFEVRDLTVTGGDARPHFQEPSGGCIWWSAGNGGGRLVLERVVVTRCVAGWYGGGIYASGGEARVTDSALTRNRAGFRGAGASFFFVEAELERVLISGNRAGQYGGGLSLSGKPVILENVTLSGNRARDGAGAIVSGDGLTLRHCTIAENRSGGGAALHFEDAVIASSILHTKHEDACAFESSTLTSGGGNLESGTSCGFAEPSDTSSVDPLLGPLEDNGGPTPTHALDPASPAVGHVDADCPADDQRGVARAAPCDAGAFELP